MEKGRFAYASSALNPAQRNYSTGEREALACLFAIERWHVLLFGRNFRLRTDHQALVTLLGSTGTGRAPMRIARWIERLRAYNFTVEYKSGVTNYVPDMLSRLPGEDTYKIDDPSETIVASLTENLRPFSWHDISHDTAEDPELQQVISTLNQQTPASALSAKWRNIFPELSLVDGVLLRGDQIVLPTSQRWRAFRIAHDDAHQGIVRTKQRLRAVYWWPSMDPFIEQAVKECRLCASHDKTAVPTTAPVATTDWPTKPWTRIAIDIRGPDSSVAVKYRFAIVVIDYYSKWAEVQLVQQTTTESVIEMLRALFHREGVPETLVSDNGTQFTSSNFKNFLIVV